MSLILLNQTITPKPRRNISLQTAKGRDIDNYQVDELSAFEISSGAALERKRPSVVFKGQPTPIYNCHGCTFASKRTNIDSTNELRKILHDDCYIQIKADIDVKGGDIVLYIDKTSNDIIHTGIVLVVHNNPVTFTVLSKWGKYKEAIHNLHDCDYDNYTNQYWRNNHGFIKGI